MVTIDYIRQSLDEILAMLNLADANPSGLAFRCTVCNDIHSTDSMLDWFNCDFRYREFADPNICATIYKLVRYDLSENLTSVIMPAVQVTVPRMFLHKLALHDYDEGAELLKQYVDLCYSFPEPVKILELHSAVPLHLAVQPQELREAVLEKINTSAAYHAYLRGMRDIINRCIDFIVEHVDLFVPYTAEPVVCRRRSILLGDISFYFPVRDTTIDVGKLIPTFSEQVDLFSVIDDRLYYDGTTLEGMFSYNCIAYEDSSVTYTTRSLPYSSDLFEFWFELISEKPFNNTLHIDPIVSHLHKVCAELNSLVRERLSPAIVHEASRACGV